MTDRNIRVILIVPANNTTMEREIRAYCPEITELELARVPRPHRPLGKADLPTYRKSTLAAVAPLTKERPDLVIYGCTSAGFLGGPQGDTEAVNQISELAGAPVVSTAIAMGAALHHSGVDHVDLVSPYVDWKNEILVSFLAASGITVAASSSFSTQNPTELAAVTADQVVQKSLEVARDDSQGLFIACVQLPTIDIVPVLISKLERPVWSAVRAAAWAALTTLSLPADRLVPDVPPHRADPATRGAGAEALAG